MVVLEYEYAQTQLSNGWLAVHAWESYRRLEGSASYHSSVVTTRVS